jgi:hypothetical protein
MNLTLYNNVLDKKNITNNNLRYQTEATSLKHFEPDFYKNNLDFYLLIKNNCTSSKLNYSNDENLYTNTNGMLLTNLKLTYKSSFNFYKVLTKKNELLFDKSSIESMLDQRPFSKSRLYNPTTKKKLVPILLQFSDIELYNSFDTPTISTLSDFFEHNILNNYNSTNIIRHNELDDETRIVKRSAGKNTPIRVLKYPNTDIFFKNSSNLNSTIDLLKFRFNEPNATICFNKPIRTTVYLTFKQKRYNQKNNIQLKNQMFLNKDLKTTQNYSGNPFLKETNIIEENYGTPKRQYKLVKKAKSRIDATKVSN